MRIRIAHALNRYSIAIVALSALALLTGCASGQTSGQALLMENPNSSTFFVERQPKDSRNLAVNITENLKQRGLEASTGEPGTMPEGTLYLVRYIDHWAWDMRMYLADLRIEVRDPTTGAIVAYGQSVQNSLKAMGWTFDTVVNLAVNEMLGQVQPDSPPSSDDSE